MKKLFIFICMVVALASCNSKEFEIPYNQYELERYNGYTVTGKFASEKEAKYTLSVHSDSTGYTTVYVSKKTYLNHDLGDTIKVERPVEEPVIDTVEDVEPLFEVNLMSVKFGNHLFVVSDKGGLEHDPDCPCFTAQE